MPAKPRGVAPKAERAAVVYEEGGMTMRQVYERFGISRTSLYDALVRLRGAREVSS